MAKRSRRARRQISQKQRQTVTERQPVPAAPPATTVDTPAVAAEVTPSPVEEAGVKPSNARKVVDFAREYFYVYSEIRIFLIIAVLMFIVLVGLSFVI